ncbi:sodium/hydrogen exchanger [Isosphaera pallida ATCC 43644]|uniref:Sodium/hydrogen exchanger n=1 Tax=Isosphaera pallida (strain ATCC 43644 / DSM 9630 / IS1B) TaxID=575540 RepID=E8QYD0_ISOPI|nr:cation:proton antiporter [Isosphaera pallida]ADV63125.1 sodium/hydrogen exchanger [Isosphaera pallida ATCC 43644]
MHHDTNILTDLVVVFAVSGTMVVLFQRLRIPTILGMMLAGVLVGPSLFNFVEAENIELLAEIGVVVLLFTVGLEFSLTRLLSMWKIMLLVGLPQMTLCLGAGTLVGRFWDGSPWNIAIFQGMLVAMSSTAVALKLLIDRGEIGTPHGRIATAVLLFQDLMVILFILALPLLADPQTAPDQQSEPGWLALGKGVGIVAAVLLAAKYLLPPLMGLVVKSRNREAFLIFVVVVCIGTAAATAWAGLSLALGAFLAGLALSESDYAHQVMSDALPFRDTLSSLFFVSLGLSLNLPHLAANLGPILSLSAFLIVVKMLTVAMPVILVGYPIRTALVAAASICQIGEFSFLLVQSGRELQLISPDLSRNFLAAGMLTMALTPPMIRIVQWLVTSSNRLTNDAFLRLQRRKRDASGNTPPSNFHSINGSTSQAQPQSPTQSQGSTSQAQPQSPTQGQPPPSPSHRNDFELEDHVVIAGFGVGGSNLARALKTAAIPYVILDVNPERVRRLRKEGEPIMYGDCSRAVILEHAGIKQARALAIMISDPTSARAAVQIARRLNPDLYILVRTPYIRELPELEKLGANVIIPEDFVSSLELFIQVLRRYRVPRNLVEDLLDEIREDQYLVLRDASKAASTRLKRELGELLDMESCLVRPDSPLAGQTLGESKLRARTGAIVVAIRRNGRLITTPDPETRFQSGDEIICVGDANQLEQAAMLIDPHFLK